MLHLRCRVYYRDENLNIVQDPSKKPMLLYGCLRYRPSSSQKERQRFTYFSVRGEEYGYAVYKFICCMVPQVEKGSSGELLKKPFIVALRLVRSCANTFYDINRGGWVRSPEFRFTHYTVQKGCEIVCVSMRMVERIHYVYEDWDNPGSFYKIALR